MKVYGGVETWAMKCDHIGQVKVFAYIIGTFNQSTHEWTMDKYKMEQIKEKAEIGEASVYTYLKGLVRKGMLEKKGKGIYLVNKEYIEYGSHK